VNPLARTKASTWLRTLAHVTPGQLGSRVLHEARRKLYDRAGEWGKLAMPFDGDTWLANETPWALPTTLPHDGHAMAALWRAGRVRYHGQEGDAADWKNRDKSRLWQYERQYQTEVLAMAAETARTGDISWVRTVRGLLVDWTEACPPLAGAAYEPYPVARRILNWSVALTIAPVLRGDLVGHLAPQVRFLARHLETHLLGNHLLCDGLAICAGAAVLRGPDMDHLWCQGAALVERELDAQVLYDGGYNERTVQYHAIVLRDALWAFALSCHRGRRLMIEGHLRAMLAWLRDVARAGGSFPWLNDASPEATPALASLEALARAAFARAAGDNEPARDNFAPHAVTNERVLALPSTGWTFVRQDKHELLFDTGPLGPPEQPGHGHADTLGYELLWDGTPLVVDTGVSTYARGATRDAERAPSAHATVSVDGEGADEVWAAFRVGGRGLLAPVRWQRLDHAFILDGEVTSFRGWHFQRRLVFWPGRALLVQDLVAHTRRRAQVRAHVPLAPGVRVTTEDQQVMLAAAEHQWRFHHFDAATCEVVPGHVAAGFGRQSPRSVLTIGREGAGALVHALTAPDVAVTSTPEGFVLSTAAARTQVPPLTGWSGS
jgi:hypothetical protein